MPKINWLDRAVIVSPHLALCGTEEEYLEAIRYLKIKDPLLWLNKASGGMTHTFERDGKITCVVTIDFAECKKYLLSEIVGILAHEATHVCQQLFSSIGEHSPSKELEAYSVQCVTQRLVEEFLRRKIKYKGAR